MRFLAGDLEVLHDLLYDTHTLLHDLLCVLFHIHNRGTIAFFSR